MNRRFFILFLISFSITSSIQAQESFLTKDLIHTIYDWEEEDLDVELSKEDSLEAAVILLDKSIYEFRTYRGDRSIKGYLTVHRKALLNNEEGLEKINKVYIPVTEKSSIFEFKARSIDKDGKVMNINQSMLKDISNVEEYGSFKIFAVEGAQIGGIIEYTYTIPVDVRYSLKEFAQGEYPVKKFSFSIKGTRDLKFKLNTNNGLSSPNYQEKGSFNLHTVEENNIPALKEEEYSSYKAARMNLDVSIKEVYGINYSGWNYIRNSYTNLIEDLGRRSSYDLDQYIRKNSSRSRQSKYEQLVALEHTIKKDINLVDGFDKDLGDVRMILKYKNANRLGFIKLFVAVLKKLDYDFELLATINRYEETFQKSSPALAYAREFLIYIPEIDAYLSPTDLNYRVGMAPYTLANSYSLIIEKGDRDRFHKIKINSKEENLVDASYSINFTNGMLNPFLNKKQVWYGHRGSLFRYTYSVIPTDKKEEFRSNMSVSGADDIKHISSTIENNEYTFLNAEKTPLILISELDLSRLIEQVGEDYIFEIGQIIGKQSELYQENERKTAITLNYPIEYIHTIKFAIPNGYKVEGLDDIVRNRKIVDEKEEIIGEYNAYYEQKSDSVHIHINEYYSITDLKVSQYESFREIINSAADFNKLSLVFTKPD